MRRLALLTVPIALLALALGGGLPSGASEPTPAPSDSPTPSPSPTDEPTPSPTLADARTHRHRQLDSLAAGRLHRGAEGRRLGRDHRHRLLPERAPRAPAHPCRIQGQDPNSTILNAFPMALSAGYQQTCYTGVHLLPPVHADGHWWWHIFAPGLGRRRLAEVHHEGSPFWPPRPELDGRRPDRLHRQRPGIWLMNATAATSACSRQKRRDLGSVA